MCVCTYVRTCVYVHMYVRVCVHMYIHVCMYTFIDCKLETCISLFPRSSAQFFVLPQTEIFFLNNHAVRVGGAIFAQQSRVTRFFLLNRDCFFQYYSPPLIDHPPDTWVSGNKI